MWIPLKTIFLSALFVSSILSLTSPVNAQETVTYQVDLKLTWSAQSHPFEFPDDPHFTPFVGATHHSRYVLFADGQTASSGLELIAENGRASILRAELAEAKRRRRIGSLIETAALDDSPSQLTFKIEVTERHYLVSLVSMIAPSPDWFVGLASVDLRSGDGWADTVTLPLLAWDAGTDSGASYFADNADTQPRESVRLLATPHVVGETGLAPFGLARFTRLNRQ